MYYVLSEEEFKDRCPAGTVRKFLEAYSAYYSRKADHFIECMRRVAEGSFGLRLGGAELMQDAIKRHNSTFTEKPPTIEDFLPQK